MKANMFSKYARKLLVVLLSVLMIGILCANQMVYSPFTQEIINPNPPAHIVKLIFIHHSCGENLLNDDNGALGLALSSNNYFVSDTYYGWGPDGIGDRTDILDWPEWFLGTNSPTYMDALFNESEQSTWYSRQVADPGGQNEVILFKSCFPNSDMGGRADDAPESGNLLTVASAKQVYLDLLATFMQHPDKLFVVLTAPPMRDISRPESTRAFNTWLVQDWLDEANYPYDNVAVWDFYNVLSGPNNHHRVVDGTIQYITDQGGNTLYYPDGEDDHPSIHGNLKAVEEFVPMLNGFYNRWQNTAPQDDQQIVQPAAQEETQQVQPVEKASLSFSESGPLDGFDEVGWTWECFADESVNTELTCNVNSREDNPGNQAYLMEFNVLQQSWATAVTFFDGPMPVFGTRGLSLEVFNPDRNPINLIVYKGDDENRETYLYPLEAGAYTDWRQITVDWSDFRRAEWESGNQESLVTDEIAGFGFGFDGLDDMSNTGRLWVDNIFWLADDQSSALSVEEMDSSGNSESGNGLLACPGAAALLFVVFTFALLHSRTRLM